MMVVVWADYSLAMGTYTGTGSSTSLSNWVSNTFEYASKAKTHTSDAVVKAREILLDASTRTSGAALVMVILTDGKPTNQSPYAANDGSGNA